MKKECIDLVRRDCEQVLAKSAGSLEKLKNECILVTGGTGFFGTQISEFICFLNDTLHYDIKLILLSQRAENFKDKAPHLAGRKDITLISRDITTLVEIPSDVSLIIHAAGSPDSRLHASDPLATTRVIVHGTAAMLEASLRLSGLKRIVNVSSGLVYGPQPPHLAHIPEDFQGGPDCNAGSSAYAEAKRYAESLCSIYRNQYKLEIITVRPFAFIGPYQLLDRPWAINNFIRDALKGGPIRILGNGQTVRSYMYPSDLAFWMMRILCDGVSGLAYNVGCPHGITLQATAEKIATHFSNTPKIVSNLSLAASASTSVFVPDISRAKEGLDLTISVDVNEAIRRTTEWFKILGA